MTIESLPSPYEITGGGNPYYSPTSNIAGFEDGPDSQTIDLPGDYDRYMQAASPFLAGLGEGPDMPLALMFSTGTYGYSRGGLLGLALGVLGGATFPRATVILYAADAFFARSRKRPLFWPT